MAWIQAAFRLFLIGGGILLLGVLYIMLIIRLYRYLQVKIARDHTVQLTNQGNVPSIFQLQVGSPEPRLHFKLLYKDMPLVEMPETPLPETPPAVYEITDSTTNQQAESQKKAAAKGSKISTSQVTDTGREIAGKAGVLASLLGTIGGLLPGSLGAQLRSKGASARRIQADTLKTTSAPARTQQKINALKMDSGKLTNAGGGTPFRDQADTPAYGQEAREPLPVARPFLQKTRHLVREYQAQTREVGPGESLSLTLRIESKAKRPLEGSYLYHIRSQQVPMTPANVEIPQVSSSGTVHFKPVTTWRYWLPLMVCGLVVVVTLFTLFIIFIQG